MNSATTYETSTTSSAATQAVARRLSRLLSGGEVIELVSDLGGGKTTFVQGLAAGLGYSGPVTSPTFALSQIYPLPSQKELHHYDLYRLTEAGVVGAELGEDVGEPHTITVIEWAGVAEDHLPIDRLTITFEPTSDTKRTLHFAAGGPVSQQLIKGLAS